MWYEFEEVYLSDDEETFKHQYLIEKQKFDFFQSLIQIDYIFWILFNRMEFANEAATKFDQKPGLHNFMVTKYWRDIDIDPTSIAPGKPIYPPNSAEQRLRKSITGRKILMIIMLFEFISDGLLNGLGKNAAGNLYQQMNLTLTQCGFAPINDKRRFGPSCVGERKNTLT